MVPVIVVLVVFLGSGIGASLSLTVHPPSSPSAESQSTGLRFDTITRFNYNSWVCNNVTSCVGYLNVEGSSALFIDVTTYSVDSPTGAAVESTYGFGAYSVAHIVSSHSLYAPAPAQEMYEVRYMANYDATIIWVNYSSPEYLTVVASDYANISPSHAASVAWNTGTGYEPACVGTPSGTGNLALMSAGTLSSNTFFSIGGFFLLGYQTTSTDVVTGGSVYEIDTGSVPVAMVVQLGTSATWWAICITVPPAAAPSPPTGLSAGIGTTTTVALTWSNGAEGPYLTNDTVLQASYTISGGCGSFSAVYTSPYGPVTSHTATGLASGYKYCWEVEATNSSGTSGPSSYVTKETIAPPPTGLTQVAPTTTMTLSVSFTPPSYGSAGFALDYELEFGGPATSTASSLCTPPLTQLGIVSVIGTTNLPLGYTYGAGPGAEWCFGMQSYDTSGLGVLSTVVMVSQLAAAPTSLSVGAVTSATVPLSWTPPATLPSNGVISSYTVLQAPYTTSCGSYATSYTGISNASPSYTVTGLPSATGFCFKVEAVTLGGASAPSSPVVAVYTIPGSPNSVVASSPTTTTIFWTWNNPLGVLTDTYFFWQAGSTCGAATKIDIGSVVTSYNLTTIAPASEYCAYVQVVSGGTPSPSSAIATGWTIPNAPTSLLAVARNTTTALLTWTNPSGTLTDNHVYRGTLQGLTCGSKVGTDLGSVKTTDTVAGLVPSTTYCFSVSASSPGGQGANSTFVIIKTGNPSAPPPPTNLYVAKEGRNWAVVNWTNPAANLTGDVAFLGLYIAGACSAYSRVSNATGPVFTQFNYTGLTPNENYCAAAVDYTATLYSSLSVPVFIFLSSAQNLTPTFITVTLGNVTGLGGSSYEASAIWYDNFPGNFTGTIYVIGDWLPTATDVVVFVNGAPVNSYNGGSRQVVPQGQITVVNGSSIQIQAKYTANPTFSFTGTSFILNNYQWTISLIIILIGISLGVLVAFSGMTGNRRTWVMDFVGVLLLTGLVGTWVSL